MDGTQAVLSLGQAVTYAAGAVLDGMTTAWRSAEECVAHACHRWQMPQHLWEDLRSLAGRVSAAADPHTSILLGQVIHGVLYTTAAVFNVMYTLHLFARCVNGTSEQQLRIS